METMSALDWLNDPAWLAPPAAAVEHRADGSFVLRSTEALGEHARCIGEWLEHWAMHTPDAPALAERTRACVTAREAEMNEEYRKVHEESDLPSEPQFVMDPALAGMRWR